MRHLTAIVPVADYLSRQRSLHEIIEGTIAYQDKLTLFIVFSGSKAHTDESNFKSSFGEAPDYIRTFLLPCSSPGLARDYGLSFVTTSWVTFWDDDDKPFPKVILESIAASIDSEMIVGQYVVRDFAREQILVRKETVSLNQLSVDTGLWRIIFLTTLAKRVSFPNSFLGEDRLYVRSILLQRPKVSFASRIHYQYSIGNNSLTSTISSSDILFDFQQHVKLSISNPEDNFGNLMTATLFISYLVKSAKPIEIVNSITKLLRLRPFLLLLLTCKALYLKGSLRLRLFRGALP